MLSTYTWRHLNPIRMKEAVWMCGSFLSCGNSLLQIKLLPCHWICFLVYTSLTQRRICRGCFPCPSYFFRQISHKPQGSIVGNARMCFPNSPLWENRHHVNMIGIDFSKQILLSGSCLRGVAGILSLRAAVEPRLSVQVWVLRSARTTRLALPASWRLKQLSVVHLSGEWNTDLLRTVWNDARQYKPTDQKAWARCSITPHRTRVLSAALGFLMGWSRNGYCRITWGGCRLQTPSTPAEAG